MKILFIFLQFGASISDPLSNTQQIFFWGIILAFVALFIYFLYRTNKIIDAKNQSTNQKETVKQNPNISAEIHEETAAAIALAIHMYKTEMHDQESFTITLKKVSKIYSPWSSKIYTLRQNPR
jgi:Na+-transporting methylmalonyl-CoA/oxaloacetate decarboxylase gamma subunit